MTKQHITLLIPGLFNSIAALPRTMPQFTALETLISRADQSELKQTAFYACVLDLFAIGSQHTIPIAAVSRYADGGDPDDYVWIHIDPVYLKADKDRLILQGSEILDMQMHEANTVIQELNAQFGADGWYCEAFTPHRWYARLPRQPEAHFHTLVDALGRSVEPYMPTGLQQSEWHRFMNEAQMLLHASSINHQRAQDDKFPVNSLWCWGPGKLPKHVTSSWHHVFSNEPFVKGLALLSKSRLNALPMTAAEVLTGLSVSPDVLDDQQILIVLESTEKDILSLNFEHYLDRLTEHENNWFSPLLRALKSKQIESINLLSCNGRKYSLKRHHLRRFWRKRQRVSVVKMT